MSIRRLLVTGFLAAMVSPVFAADRPAIKPPKNGVAFDGKTAYALPVDALALKPKALTVSAWVKIKSIRDSQAFMNVGQVNSAFTFYVYALRLRMLIGHQEFAYAFADGEPPEGGAWTHCAGSYDGKIIRLYRNGAPAGTLEVNGRVEGLFGNLYIGSVDKNQRFFLGELEDLRIWRRVLKDDEIAEVAAGQTSPALDRELAARWTLANLSGDTWKTEPASVPAAERVQRSLLINTKDDSYNGIWYMNQPSKDEYKYKYSGGMGTYCANHIPHAVYSPEADKTFFVYGGTTHDSFTHLVHMVSYYDHKTGMVPKPTILLDKDTTDAHDNPILSLDDKGYLWVFSSSHGRGRPSYISKSKQPYSIDEFELVWTGNFSYPQAWHIPGQGFMFLHTYYNPGRTLCLMTSPDGVTWSERELYSSIHEGHYQVSRARPGGVVGTSFMYHPNGKGLNWRTNLYYIESADFGKTWKTADGKVMATPLKDVISPALVHEYQSEGLLVYIQDLNFTAEGHPVILYTTSKGYESGPANGPRYWTTAHWTGTKWDINGKDIIADNNYDLGSIYIEAPDLWRIIGPSQNGPQAYNTGGEVAMWESTDQGKNWKMTRQMTKRSEFNQNFVRRPVNAHPDFYAFWADGHGRKPSASRLYYCNKKGDVFRLPSKMSAPFQKPERVVPK